MKQYCYYVSWLKETRLPKKPGTASRVMVEGSSRWFRVWMHQYHPEYKAEFMLKEWASKFFGVDHKHVQVVRIAFEDRIVINKAA
jgi:hypothetical protein